ncbi:Retrotransposon gag protein [Arachis hypogaea]|nr:Retrotransposon gag protein [Arachis hypogaea]
MVAIQWLDYIASALASLEEPSETLDGTKSDLESTFNEETFYSSVGTNDISLHTAVHGLPGQDPIRNLRDFQVACSMTQRHGAYEIAIMVFAFPFSLEGQAKEWFYSQPDEVVTEWDLLRREFLDKFFLPE